MQSAAGPSLCNRTGRLVICDTDNYITSLQTKTEHIKMNKFIVCWLTKPTKCIEYWMTIWWHIVYTSTKYFSSVLFTIVMTILLGSLPPPCPANANGWLSGDLIKILSNFTTQMSTFPSLIYAMFRKPSDIILTKNIQWHLLLLKTQSQQHYEWLSNASFFPLTSPYLWHFLQLVAMAISHLGIRCAYGCGWGWSFTSLTKY